MINQRPRVDQVLVVVDHICHAMFLKAGGICKDVFFGMDTDNGRRKPSREVSAVVLGLGDTCETCTGPTKIGLASAFENGEVDERKDEKENDDDLVDRDSNRVTVSENANVSDDAAHS